MKGYASGIIDDFECAINNETYYISGTWYSTAELINDYEDGWYKCTDIENEEFELKPTRITKFENGDEIEVDDIELESDIENKVYELIASDICYEVS